MTTSLLALTIRCKLDLVLARQRARQVARVLGLDEPGQVRLACGVFEMACRLSEQVGRHRVRFVLGAGKLVVRFEKAKRTPAGGSRSLAASPPALAIALPRGLPLSAADVAWVVRQLEQETAVDCFAEMRRQNLDLLQTLVDLGRARAHAAPAGGQPPQTAAA